MDGWTKAMFTSTKWLLGLVADLSHARSELV